MNPELQKAEQALLELLHGRDWGLSMPEIPEQLKGIAEAEIRAAVWTLRAEGAVDFEDGKLRDVQAA